MFLTWLNQKFKKFASLLAQGLGIKKKETGRERERAMAAAHAANAANAAHAANAANQEVSPPSPPLLSSEEEQELAMLNKEGQRLLSNKQYKLASHHYKGIINRYPHRHEGWAGKAKACLKLKKYDKAIMLAETATDLAPKNPETAEILVTLGRCYRAKTQFDHAKKNYRRAVDLNPDHAIAWHALGCLYNITGQFDLADAHLRMALLCNPNFAKAWNNLGIANEGSGRLQEALRNYEKAVALNPNFVEAWCNLGAIHRTLNQHDKASEYLIKAIAINPDLTKAWNELSWVQPFGDLCHYVRNNCLPLTTSEDNRLKLAQKLAELEAKEEWKAAALGCTALVSAAPTLSLLIKEKNCKLKIGAYKELQERYATLAQNPEWKSFAEASLNEIKEHQQTERFEQEILKCFDKKDYTEARKLCLKRQLENPNDTRPAFYLSQLASPHVIAYEPGENVRHVPSLLELCYRALNYDSRYFAEQGMLSVTNVGFNPVAQHLLEKDKKLPLVLKENKKAPISPRPSGSRCWLEKIEEIDSHPNAITAIQT